uniref:Rad21/Rec8-like protein C-terminal eukaryotic domain-containing protein n=1 Tax=Sphenodon punctatus TaxID=8508 RepID=A0A8D0LCT2_SPHPU
MQQDELINELMGNDQDKEEKMRKKRTLWLLNSLQHISQTGASSFSFLELCKNNSQKCVAAKFYSLLVLKKLLVVGLAQTAPYADIIVTLGPEFHMF